MSGGDDRKRGVVESSLLDCFWQEQSSKLDSTKGAKQSSKLDSTKSAEQSSKLDSTKSAEQSSKLDSTGPRGGLGSYNYTGRPV